MQGYLGSSYLLPETRGLLWKSVKICPCHAVSPRIQNAGWCIPGLYDWQLKACITPFRCTAFPFSSEQWSFAGFVTAIKAFDISAFAGIIYIVGASLWTLEALFSLWVLKDVSPEGAAAKCISHMTCDLRQCLQMSADEELEGAWTNHDGDLAWNQQGWGGSMWCQNGWLLCAVSQCAYKPVSCLLERLQPYRLTLTASHT